MGRDHLVDLGLDGEITLECFLGKWDGRVWTGFVWFGIITSGGLL